MRPSRGASGGPPADVARHRAHRLRMGHVLAGLTRQFLGHLVQEPLDGFELPGFFRMSHSKEQPLVLTREALDLLALRHAQPSRIRGTGSLRGLNPPREGGVAETQVLGNVRAAPVARLALGQDTGLEFGSVLAFLRSMDSFPLFLLKGASVHEIEASPWGPPASRFGTNLWQ